MICIEGDVFLTIFLINGLLFNYHLATFPGSLGYSWAILEPELSPGFRGHFSNIKGLCSNLEYFVLFVA